MKTSCVKTDSLVSADQLKLRHIFIMNKNEAQLYFSPKSAEKNKTSQLKQKVKHKNSP